MRWILLLALFVPTSLQAQSREYPPTFDGAREETYKLAGGVDLKLWVFDPPNHRSGDKRPAIVFFFGGGWKSGNPAQFEQHCRYFASRGMVAITADYRVRERHDTLADKCVADAKSAIRWIRQNAQRLGIDPDRVVAGGGSAGGHLAACAGVIDGLDEPSEQSSNISSVPNALALFNPAVLLAPFESVALTEEKTSDIATRTGVKPERISPIHHVRSGLPPTIIFHGQADTTVPYATVHEYAKVAAAAGNRCELVGYRGAKHGFFNVGRDGNPGEFYPTTVHRLDLFLRSLGYVEGPPSIATPIFDNVHLRSHFDNSLFAFEQRKKGTVAFIGGSITQMKGYRVMVENALRRRFPDTELQFINAGVSSTCSTTGAFRLTRDVLSADPDLLFVEFAVNDDQDAVHTARECTRGMEGILRQAREHNPHMDIIVTHFVNPPMLELLQSDQTPISSGEHEAVAKHYGVSTIDLAREVAERISAGELSWKEYGGTHPAEAGNRIATDMIQDMLSAAWATRLASESQLPAHRIPKMLDPGSYSTGKLVDVSTAQCDDRWKIERPEWSEIKGSMRETFADETLLCATDIGAQLTLPFRGTAVGMYLLAGPDAGTIEYSIDDGPVHSVDTYHRFSKGLHYPRTVMFNADLERGDHTLTLRVSKSRNGDSSGHAVRILNFVVN